LTCKASPDRDNDATGVEAGVDPLVDAGATGLVKVGLDVDARLA
jgi:hypothetical protein